MRFPKSLVGKFANLIVNSFFLERSLRFANGSDFRIAIGAAWKLIDLLRNAPTVSLDAVEILVLDEADRLLDLGFRDEVNAQL